MELELPLKENPWWTKCVFDGPPPCGYSNWSDWIVKSAETGLYTGVHIKAINPADNVDIETKDKN